MDAPDKILRGSEQHKAALIKVGQAQMTAGYERQDYIDALKELERIQKRIDWQLTEGELERKPTGQLSVQCFNNRFERVLKGTSKSFEWSTLKKNLTSRECAKKEDAGMFELTRFFSNTGFEHVSVTYDGQDRRLPVCGESRCKWNVEYVDGLTLDYDAGISVEDFQAKHPDLEYLLYSSYNHDPEKGKHKFRVVIPLKTRVGAAEVANRKAALMKQFPGVDPASFSISQAFYLPSHPPGQTPVRIENTGAWFELMRLDKDTARSREPSREPLSTSTRVTSEVDAGKVIAAIMNCMPPDTEYLRVLKGCDGHSYAPFIVPFLFSLGYWGKENGMETEEILDLVEQRWAGTEHVDSFYRLVDGSNYGNLDVCESFVDRVQHGIKKGLDLGFKPSEFDKAWQEFNKTLSSQGQTELPELFQPKVAKDKLNNKLVNYIWQYCSPDQIKNHLVVRFEAGAGKTQAAHMLLGLSVYIAQAKNEKKNGVVVDYLVPDNSLGEEVTKRLYREYNTKLQMQNPWEVRKIEGRDSLCIDQKVKEAKDLGHKIDNPCEGCTLTDSCEYPKQFREKEKLNLIRVIYQGMISNRLSRFDKVEAPDFYFIDEDVIATLYTETVYGHEYDFVKELDADLDVNSTADEIGRGIITKLKSEVRQLEREAERAKPLAPVQFSRYRRGEISEAVFKQQIEKQKTERLARNKRPSLAAVKLLLHDIEFSRRQCVSIRVTDNKSRVVVASRLKPLASRYAEAPCIYLDATVEHLIVKQALRDHEGLGHNVDYWECNVAYSEKVTVQQDTSRSWSMQSLCPLVGGKRSVNEGLLRVAWDEMVRRSLNLGKPFAVVTYKTVADFINAGKVPAGSRSIKDSELFLGVGHFGKIRGQDHFNQKGIEHLYVIGRMQVSSTVLHDHARAIFGREHEPLSFNQGMVRVNVGPGVRLKTQRYLDPRVQAVDNMLNAAETAQAAHRLRLIYGDTPKELFLMTNACVPVRVNKVMDVHSGGADTKRDRLLLELRGSIAAGEVAIKSGEKWITCPTSLVTEEQRMRKQVLDEAVATLDVVSFSGFDCCLRTKNRKKRDVVVLARNEETVRDALGTQYPEDLVEDVKLRH